MNQNQIDEVMKILTSKWISSLLFVAAELGIADILADKRMTCDGIAAETGVDSNRLYRLLRALSAARFFREREDGRFENTALSECLRKRELRPMVRMFCAPWHNRAWDMLLPALSSETPAFEIAHGNSAFPWLSDHPNEGAVFNEANARKSRGIAAAVAEKYNFDGHRRILDIGGGNGVLLIEILKRYREAEGTVADLPHVVGTASERISREGLRDRCTVMPIDFMTEIPGGFDLYILCNILHDWDDDHAARILVNCRRAMSRKAVLLVIEMPVPAGEGFSMAKLMDLEVMIMGGGRERTGAEYTGLCTRTGFRLLNEIPFGDYSAFGYNPA